MSDPIDPWAVRPEGRASEPRADDVRPTEDLHTADPAAAYGHAPNPTLAYPTYDSLVQQQAAQRPPYGWPGGPQPMPPPPAPVRRSIALLVAAGIGLGFLVAALIGGAYLLVRPHDESSAAPGPQDTITQLPAHPFPGAPQAPDGRGSRLPGPFGAPAPGTTYGATVGNITANDGATLSVQGVLGDKTNVVHTTDQTRVLGVNRVKVADLKIGDMVIVQGDKAADGTITARLIISTALGGGN